MKTLETVTLLDLLPPNFKTKAHCHALSAALNAAFQEIIGHSEKVKVYADLDHLAESGLDLLAAQWKIKGYKNTLPIVNKRQLVKSGLLYQLFSGTAKVIKDKVKAIYNGDAMVKEWFEYDGDPYRFQVDIETNNGFSRVQLDEAELFIQENKNARSHLERFKVQLKNNLPLFLGMGVQNGEALRVFPFLVKTHHAQINTYLSGFSLSGEIITVCPKGQREYSANMLLSISGFTWGSETIEVWPKIEKEYIGTMNACLTGFLLGSENITILPKEEQLEGV